MKQRAHVEPAFPPYFLERSFRCTLAEALERATLVSFDIFDTLLRRPFLEPTHLFDALGSARDCPNFGRDRRWAEAQARNRHSALLDITAAQIYEHLPHNLEDELAFEAAHLAPRAEITTWLNLARAKGKKVVAISDMYLPRDFLKGILAKHRIIVDDIIVSSQDGVAKWDGSAYRLVSARHGVAFADMLHFGDNISSDYDAPRKLGIKAVLVANNLPRGSDKHHLARLVAALETNGSFHGSMVGSIIRDSLVGRGPVGFWQDIGRYIVAPLNVGFAQWIGEEARQRELKTVAFAARDGKMARQAFLALNGDNFHAPYVHLSRAVVLRASLDTRSDMVLHQLCSGIDAPVSDYIRRIGDGVAGLLKKANDHFGGDPVVGPDIRRDDLAEFFHQARGDLNAIAEKERPLLYRYLEQEGLLNKPEKVGVVDVGWGGTAASVLWDAVSESRHWTWLYFGSRQDYRPSAAKQKGMFFSYGIPHEHQALVFDCVEIVEFLFTSAEPSTVGLLDTPTGVEPVHAPEATQWEGWAPRVSEMQHGFTDMLPAFMRRAKSDPPLTIDLPTVRTLIAHLIHSDSLTVIREFGALEHQLGFGASRFEPLICLQNMRYWSNIWRLLKGRPIKPAKGSRYWKNQLTGQFLLPLTGWRKRLANAAVKAHARGGLMPRRKRR